MRSTWHLPLRIGSLIRHTCLIAVFGGVTAGCRTSGNDAPIASENQSPSALILDVRPTEVYEAMYPDGKVQRLTEAYKNANDEFVFHGETRTFYQSGEKQSLVTFVSGVRHGPRIAWYRNGTLRSQGQFVDGREQGMWITWYPNGQKSQERYYDHGAYHGTFKSWHMTGKKKSQGNWTKGKKQGIHVVWDEVGDVFESIEYVDNVPQP